MQLNTEFDPYHKWLGIPPAEQPPSHFRLLGINPGEDDPDVIHAAADRQMAYLRTMQIGAHAAEASRLLSEVAGARIALVDPARRASYNAVLQSAVPAAAVEQEAEPARPAAKPVLLGTASGTFGSLEILQTLARSPLGEVHRARHIPTGRLVPRKALPLESTASRELLSPYDHKQKLTATLRHANLIQGFAAGVHAGIPFLVMEYVEGTDLAKLVEVVGPLSVAEAVGYCTQAARGLMQLHLNGVVHRNVKPQVLLVDRQGRVQVTNLFLARSEQQSALGGGENLTMTGQTMGTTDYLAPEQARDARLVTERTDIYALGCTLHFLLTGRPPFGGRTMQEKLRGHLTLPPPELRNERPEIPRRLEELFHRMLSKEPAGRPANMGEVATLLDRSSEPELTWFEKLLRPFRPKK